MNQPATWTPVPAPKFCTDNAVMVGISGYFSFQGGKKYSLKQLSRQYLDKQIQSTGKEGVMGHSSVEDATATMQLVQLQVLSVWW